MLRARSLLSLLAVASIVAACGSSSPTPAPSLSEAPSAAASVAASEAPSATATTAPASATPAPSVSAAPSPSPSAAADLAATFNKAIADPLWAPHLEYKGISTSSGTTSAMQGSLDSSLGQWHATATVGRTTSESLSDGATGYTKQYGVWFKAPVKNVTLATMLAAAKGFTDSGVEDKNGQQLHHMVLPAGTVVDAAALGVPAGGDAQVTLDGWADDTGSPVAFTLNATWTATGKTPVARTIAVEIAVTTPAAAVTMPTEDELWAWKTNAAKHYTVAYPSTWEYKRGSAKKYDFIDGYDGTYAALSRYTTYGFSLATIVSYARSHVGSVSGMTGAKLVSNSAARLGGAKARLLVIKGKYKGSVRYMYDCITARGGYFYELVLVFPRKPNAADLVIWNAFLTTYKFK